MEPNEAGSRTSSGASSHALLSIYLSDHMAGAGAGTALAGRLLRRHRGTDMEHDLEWLHGMIVEDRETLAGMLRRLEVRPAGYKLALARVGEAITRLKLNGSALRRSPLSTLIELEAMLLGVYGKRCGWQAMRTLADDVAALDAAQLEGLIARADQQIERLENLRRTAARRALIAARPA